MDFWYRYCGCHEWAERRWLGGCRVWFERCRDCSAIRISRVNDMIVVNKGVRTDYVKSNRSDFRDEGFLDKVLREARDI